MKKIYCELDNEDYAQISIDDGLVEISLAQGNDMNVVVFSPDKIRKLRKQLKKALEAIEGVGDDIKEDTQGESGNDNGLKFYVGDKVRIVGNTFRGIGFGHHFEIGSIVEIMEVAPGTKQPYRSGNGAGWLASEDIEQA